MLVHGVVTSIDGYQTVVKIGYDQTVKVWSSDLETVQSYDLASASTSEVEARLEAAGDGWSEWGTTPRLVPGLGVVTVVDHIGGGEGDGYYMAIVLRVEDSETTRYFRKEGSYDSWEGGDWDGDFEEVAPKPVERIEYEVKR